MAKPRKGAAAPVFETPDDEEMDALEQEVVQTTPLTDNAIDVPIFAGQDGRSLRSISKLLLYKIEMGGGPPAYKGQIPLNSTLDTIGMLHGDGIFMIEGCNAKGVVLLTKDNFRIALGVSGPKSEASGIALDYERAERQTDKFLQMIITTTQAQAERERTNNAAREREQAAFMAGMLASQQQAFQQMMTMTQQNHTYAMQTVTAARDTEGNPMEVLMRGIDLGRELDTGNVTDKPMWSQILQSGASLLADVHKRSSANALAAANPGARTLPTLNRKQRRELQIAIRLLREVRSKGIDPRTLLARLSSERPAPGETERPSVPPPDETPEDDGEELDENDEAGDEENDEADDENVDRELVEQADEVVNRHGRKSPVSERELEDSP